MNVISQPTRPMPSLDAERSAALQVTVVQDGARLHYALPLALKAAGILGTVHTDWFVQPGSLEAAFAGVAAHLSGNVGSRLAGRRCVGLDGSRVVTTGWSSLAHRLLEGRSALSEETFVQRSQAMTLQVLRDGWRDSRVLAGFVRNIDPSLCEAARRQGIAVVVDQMIAPLDLQLREEARQVELWPGWEAVAAPSGAEMMRRIERRSWSTANHITCASAYVRDGLLAEGIRPDSISVIPYPIDAAAFPYSDRSRRSGPVRVGFVGSVSLRKGAPAFLEVAKEFDPAIAQFVMVGPVSLNPAVVAKDRSRAQFVGAVPRSAVRQWLQQFDIFLFPSVCEGAAGAVMEAMSTGLPVVTTPNSGTPVRHGIEGYIHNCHDIAAIKASIARLVSDPELRLQMGAAARRRVEDMSIVRYGAAWHELLSSVVEDRAPPSLWRSGF